MLREQKFSDLERKWSLDTRVWTIEGPGKLTIEKLLCKKVSNSCGKVVSGAHNRLLCTKLHTGIAMRSSRFHQL